MHSFKASIVTTPLFKAKRGFSLIFKLNLFLQSLAREFFHIQVVSTLVKHCGSSVFLRSRTSRGLRYAHLSFNQDSVHYTGGETSDPNHSDQTLWLGPHDSPLHSPGINGEPIVAVRSRTTSNSSNPLLSSDMTALACGKLLLVCVCAPLNSL